MAYEIGYPVDFRSAGDTTRDAFAKHINEIRRIYSYLNDLDTNKATANALSTQTAALEAHKTSTNPHPNVQKPSYAFTEITGNLDATRVSGTLTNAYINYSSINNLSGLKSELVSEVTSDLTIPYTKVTALDAHIVEVVEADVNNRIKRFALKTEFDAQKAIIVSFRDELEQLGNRISALGG